jgi:hypothetical protein
MYPFTALTAAFAIGFMPVDQSAFQYNVVVRGMVLDSFHHRPIPHAIVYAVADTFFQETITNSTGYFYFLNLLPGDYRFVGHARGYEYGCACCWHDPVELVAGLEYNATVWLTNACI